MTQKEKKPEKKKLTFYYVENLKLKCLQSIDFILKINLFQIFIISNLVNGIDFITLFRI